jgi:hypothetical protein
VGSGENYIVMTMGRPSQSDVAPIFLMTIGIINSRFGQAIRDCLKEAAFERIQRDAGRLLDHILRTQSARKIFVALSNLVEALKHDKMIPDDGRISAEPETELL